MLKRRLRRTIFKRLGSRPFLRSLSTLGQHQQPPTRTGTKSSLPTVAHISSTGIDDKTSELRIEWSDGSQSSFPAIFLRDNCTDAKTPNGQRLFETHQLSDVATRIDSYAVDTDTSDVRIAWRDASSSHFTAAWLYANSLTRTHRRQRRQRLRERVRVWTRDTLSAPNAVCTYAQLQQSSQHRMAVYQELRAHGVCVIDDCPRAEEYDANGDPPVVIVGNALGFVRSTNYGTYFDVRSMPVKDAVNLAYTAKGLSTHTDNAYRDPTPGMQLLHCIKQAELSQQGDGRDGNTLLTDGFAVAMRMREQHREQFELLSTIKRPFTYYDLDEEGVLLHKHRYVIGVDTDGEIETIHFNNRTASCMDWDIDASQVDAYYDAWRMFGQLCNDATFPFVMECRLEGGQLLAFDNRRLLHGREEYQEDERFLDAKTGHDLSRHLQGCYLDVDTVWGRLDAYEHKQQRAQLQDD